MTGFDPHAIGRLGLVMCLLLLGSCGAEPTQGSSMTPDIHSSRISLDWTGTYRGTLPCADCEGIDTSVTLFEDGRYARQTSYLGKGAEPVTDEGRFVWDASGEKITLEPKDGWPQMYEVGENVLIHLDREGHRIDGDLSDRYRLVKTRAGGR